MKIEELIKNELVQYNDVHFLKNHNTFKYNDGDEVENYILDFIKNSKDISSSSQELEKGIKDWPSLYHLSRERSAVYNSLDLPRNATVLEVGCGCGAITRFLGENVNQVLALEGSPRRAEIARTRTRDLNSVSVLCASFEDVVFKGQFDIIVCNGVLEYAPLFVNQEDPVRHFLKILMLLLKPSGHFLVAIENKVGLRYFSSIKEEHTNIMFDGLEGYARFPKGPRTFGYLELNSLLSEHCSSIETLLPLPDYKLPRIVIHTNLLDEVNCADLFATSLRYDYDTYCEPRIHERLMLHELQKNKLMKEFSNSFFMIASRNPVTLLKQGWMGDIYSIKRANSKMTRTSILKKNNGEIFTTKKYLKVEPEDKNSPIKNDIDESLWVNGISIHTYVSRIMLQCDGKNSLTENLMELMQLWWNEVQKFTDDQGILSGEAVDCIWQNAIVENGKIIFIDKEYRSFVNFECFSVIYRAVTNFASAEGYYLRRWNRKNQFLSEFSFMKAVAKAVGTKVTLHSLIKAMDCDLMLQKTVHGSQTGRLKRFARLFIPFIILKFHKDMISFLRVTGKRFYRVTGRIIRCP